MKSTQNEKRYFAASNSYAGFKSYFNEIFNPYDFEKTYIIKGGPGTGKSSIMKRIYNHFIEKKALCEAIFCSSDPHSFDGVIIEGDKRIAVVDGTSPHSKDTVLPGVLDSIVNLEPNLNQSLLKNNREKIKNLSVLKSKRYNDAYEYLQICSEIENKVFREISECYTGDDISEIEEMLSVINSRGKSKKRLITSYGKNGFGYLDTLDKNAKSVYNAVGVYGSEYIFMNHLCDKSKEKGLSATLCPAPLNYNNVDAIYFEAEEIAFISGTRNRDGDCVVIDTSRYIDNKKLSSKKDKLEFLWKEREIFLWNSADEFKKAADIHKELESFYSSAMDFSKNDELCDKIISEIEELML